MAATKKKVNTIGWTGNQLENIASKKPELSIVAGAIRANGGRTNKLVYK